MIFSIKICFSLIFYPTFKKKMFFYVSLIYWCPYPAPIPSNNAQINFQIDHCLLFLRNQSTTPRCDFLKFVLIPWCPYQSLHIKVSTSSSPHCVPALKMIMLSQLAIHNPISLSFNWFFLCAFYAASPLSTPEIIKSAKYQTNTHTVYILFITAKCEMKRWKSKKKITEINPHLLMTTPSSVSLPFFFNFHHCPASS